MARLPYFKDMTDDELRTQYRHWRTLAWNASEMATMTTGRGRTATRVAASWGQCLRACELIEAIAAKRGIRLT